MAQLFSRGWKVVQGPTTENSALAKQDSKRRPANVEPANQSWWRWRQRRFAAIGWGYVALMIVIFSLSSAWSLLLIVLNLEPDRSANYILQSESLDYGHFWQSRKAPLSIQAMTTVLLIVVVGVYWYLLYLLLIRPPQRRTRSERSKSKRQSTKPLKQDKTSCSTLILVLRRVASIVLQIFQSVISTDGKYRKVWNVLMEIPDVILQILSLREYMAQGLDSSLLYCYASLMALNAFTVFYHVQFRWNEAAFHHILKDSILDATCAVFFPALILFYSFFVFQDDLKAVKIRQQFFPPRVFERKARNYVSAKEMNLFSTDFESLLIRNGWDIFLKLSFSLLACLRWTRITSVLLKRERKLSRGLSHKSASESLTTLTMNKEKSVAPLDTLSAVAQQPEKRDETVESNRLLRFGLRTAVGLMFLVYGIGCIVYTAVAVQVSRASCSSYPQCVQYSYQWILGESNDQCHCLAYVDRELAPANTQELVDVTQTLATLAAVGKLQTVQLVNRKINRSLPNALESCKGLRNLVLIHTGVKVFPSWTATSFSKLEYLHIEGDTSDINLTELPSDLFTSMTNLHTIHLSYHKYLPTLPSMVGLRSLESAYFGYLSLTTDVPSMEDLPSIQVLALEGLSHVRTLPDIEQYRDTLQMVFVQDSAACCSGFLNGGVCNTTFLNCCERDNSDDSSDDPLPPTCLNIPDENTLLPTNTSLSVLSRFAANVSNFCDPAQAKCPFAHKLNSIWTPEDVCLGVLYRECTSEYLGVGICFNQDMGRVKCVHSQTVIDMRKAEIQAGCECDEIEEKWLGCE
ncbi:hypothetical protein PPTG_16367 [Phytophthora nicotianae INRA-310]|uniref:WLGC domain-containing protein n=1 Tax=Phytophthora nicotianae (strain INRA-310) TaxID=761204 RepID=W2PT13_PHYN3|nr:hypothetical protein PPTG_16367 [Phytophthora nicotianae INRA-310]ETN03339.1 hypothetical protein PPTG_16367 [Phytophthora nicotianae INRA-310]